MVRVIFILVYLYYRNPKFFQKDLLFCFCKILNHGSEQLIMSLLYTLLCEQLFLCSASSCSFSQPEVLLLGCVHRGCARVTATPCLVLDWCEVLPFSENSLYIHTWIICIVICSQRQLFQLNYVVKAWQDMLSWYLCCSFRKRQLAQGCTPGTASARDGLCVSRGLMDPIISWQCFMIHPFPAFPQYLTSPGWAPSWIGDIWCSRVLSLPAGGSY